MNPRLSRDAIAIVKMTAPAFKMFGREIANATYGRLAANPEARAMFGKDALNGRLDRPEQLTEFLYSVALHIDALEKVDAQLDVMAARHVAEGVTPAHYPYIADALLSAIRDVLGEGASDRVIDGWHDGFWAMADVLMAREAVLYGTALPATERAA